MTSIIAVTVGDMNGIGPEVALKAIRRHRGASVPLLIGPPEVFSYYADRYKIRLRIETLPGTADIRATARAMWKHHTIPLLDLPDRQTAAVVHPGSVSAVAADFAARAIMLAVEQILRGNVDAMVTAPVSKSALHKAGYRWPGQTEMIQHLCRGPRVAMMLVTKTLRVGLVTIHLPLKDVAASITQRLVIERVSTIHNALRIDWRIPRPRLAVLGLNPHAGESRDLGDEESLQIEPALRSLRAKRMHVEGPFPADGFFARYVPGAYDAVVAMYHDQGLIPLKLLAHGSGVNVSVGLPLVRTSPDHGTAFDIAGKGKADSGSMAEAIVLAGSIVQNRKRKKT